MARKKKPEIAPLTPAEIKEQVAELHTIFGGEPLPDAETFTPQTEPEADTPLPEKYKEVWERMQPNMGIFEDVNNPNSWLRKNMFNAKEVGNGLYQFNGYLTGGKPTTFKLIKKK